MIVNRLYAKLGMQVKIVRKRRGLTQKQISRKIGITQAHLSRLELGVQAPRFSVLLRMCRAYGVRPSELLKSIGM